MGRKNPADLLTTTLLSALLLAAAPATGTHTEASPDSQPDPAMETPENLSKEDFELLKNLELLEVLDVLERMEPAEASRPNRIDKGAQKR